MNILQKVYDAQTYKSDKGGKHTYIKNYYSHKFEPIQEQVKKILEIGVLKGASLKLWHAFFDKAVIHGIDKKNRWFAYDREGYTDRCTTHLGMSNEASTYKSIPQDFDIIIDDGGHDYITQADTFKLAWSHLKLGGTYIIEDVIDIDGDIEKFKKLHASCKVFDFRSESGLFDDVIVEYTKTL